MKKEKKTEPEDIQAEIEMLRGLIGRLYRRTEDLEDIDELTRALGALGLSSTRLSGLLRVQKLLGGSNSDAVAQAISQAISETMQEMGIHL
jgi:uncharacterized protein YwlG (UPF0340 family)